MEHNEETANLMRRRLEAISQDRIFPVSEYHCEVCKDTGFARVEAGVIRCECQKRKIIEARLHEIPKHFRDSTFRNYEPINPRQVKAHERISSEFAKSFFIYGDYAQGKTHLAIAQYRKLIELEQPCLFLSMAELMFELRKSEIDSDYFCLVRERVRYAERFHLFIDDIDKFKTTDFKFEALFDLIDNVYKRDLALTVTSNHSMKMLSMNRLLDPAILRRIDDICEAVEV
jgi:DNA replication protein DnaC